MIIAPCGWRMAVFSRGKEGVNAGRIRPRNLEAARGLMANGMFG